MARLNKHDRNEKFVKRREKQVKELGLGKCYKHAGAFRKQHPLDCGNPKCMVCHSQKVLDIKSHKDEVNDLRFSEQLNDQLFDRHKFCTYGGVNNRQLYKILMAAPMDLGTDATNVS